MYIQGIYTLKDVYNKLHYYFLYTILYYKKTPIYILIFWHLCDTTIVRKYFSVENLNIHCLGPKPKVATNHLSDHT